MTLNAKINQKYYQILELSDYQDSRARKNQWFDLSTDLHKFQQSTVTKLEDNMPLVRDNQEFQYWIETLLLALFGKPGCQFWNAGNKIENIFIENVSITEKKFVWDTIEKTKL